jgi:hypothetical protein
MSLRTTASRYLALACFVLAAGLGAAHGADNAATERAKKSASDQKKLIDEANNQAKSLLAEAERLKKQYADATEEQKKAIRGKIEERKKALEELTALIARQLRDEQRKARAEAAKK